MLGVIDIRSLTKAYDEQRVVDELSFTARPGEVTGFLGPNGSGKTTTFRCVLGLAEPTSGEALVGGRRYRDLDSPRTEVGAMFEATGFHPSRTGRNHLRVIATSSGLDRTDVDALLDLVGLTTAADRRVGGYSLGMRQRLGLAAAMLGDPATIVLDEPANGLDPEGVTWIRQLLRAWANEGRTVLVASHQLAELAQVVDHVVVVRDGRLAADIDMTTLPDEVIVRVEETDVMLEALDRATIRHEATSDGAILAAGSTAKAIGELAAAAGVTVIALAPVSAGDRLEALFLNQAGSAR
ncbi:ATP-binding cassette domain-containing protein [Aquihabitans daechungensis]|uniref:ATP-binding cassette domain-containing protein n=1 Tax=Aquihabitans daechungensis TaxID=1052257 RepID=UPI003BA316D0